MSKLKKILVRARRQVFSEMVGNNPSIFQGEGYDFIELREYMPGDDIRHIDWNVTAKMRKPYIKIFKEERELNVVVASILNGSVHFGSKVFKQDYIAQIVALLGFSTLKNGDLLSSYIFTDKIISNLKPSKNINQVQKIVKNILDFNALEQKLDFKSIADSLYKRLKRKSLIIIVGDFFEIPDFKILAKKHEVVCIIVRDIFEEKPPKMGLCSLVDPENSKAIDSDFNSASIKLYEKNVKAHDHKLYETFRKHQVRFTKIYTHDLANVKLRRLFEAR
jgi:uncharacterized protein (DUF58 family)